MITKEQAVNERNREFHFGNCCKVVGPRGGVNKFIVRYRRTGKTQVWKRNEKKFRVPICHGLRGFYEITEHNESLFHLPEDCPAK